MRVGLISHIGICCTCIVQYSSFFSVLRLKLLGLLPLAFILLSGIHKFPIGVNSYLILASLYSAICIFKIMLTKFFQQGSYFAQLAVFCNANLTQNENENISFTIFPIDADSRP